MEVYELLEHLDKVVESGDPSDKTIAFIKHIRDSIELSSMLNDDLADARDLFEEHNFEFAARTFVRTMSAEFEARLFQLQRLLLFTDQYEGNDLTIQEQIILRGEAPYIKGNGMAGTAARYHPFTDNIIFTLRLAQRVFGPHVKCDTKDPRWIDVKKFIAIRNRITHPKQISDLDILESEGESLNRAQDWLREAFKSIFMHPSLLKHIADHGAQT